VIRYAITDRSLLTLNEDRAWEALEEQCARLARDGVDVLQLREKDLAPPELAVVSRRVLRAVRAVGGVTKVVINSGVDAAVSIGADGVHVRLEVVAAARAAYEDAGLAAPWVSVSCHTLDEVRAARTMSVDAILFGPVFGKNVKGVEVSAAVGLTALSAACGEAGPVPVLALGGVDAGRVAECLEAGAAGVAAIRMFLFKD
jgi:thiamine-phosphate pyrophosphorylase